MNYTELHNEDEIYRIIVDHCYYSFRSFIAINFLSSKVYAKDYVVFTRVQSAAGTILLCFEK